MILFLKNFDILVKIDTFVILSTIAFGVLMAILFFYLLGDLKETVQRELSAMVQEISHSLSSADEKLGQNHQGVSHVKTKPDAA